MANKKGVVVYYDIIEQLEDFTDEQVGKMFRAIVNYDKSGIVPNFTGEMKVAFKFIKLTIDRNNADYETKCEKNRENANKRWHAMACDGMRIDANDAYKDKDKDKDIDIDKEEEVYKKNLTNSSTHSLDLENNSFQSLEDNCMDMGQCHDNVPVKEQKHKYGEYKHVLLTDTELSKLKQDYGEEKTDKAITYLDEYIEMKGAKYKSHYLALRKWVFDALKEKEKNEPKDCFATFREAMEELENERRGRE